MNLRVLVANCGEHEQRHGTWEEAINALHMSERGRSHFDDTTTVKFPRPISGSSCFMLRFGGSSRGDKIHDERHMWVEALELVGCCDHINVGGVAVLEHVSRVIQILIDALNDSSAT